MAYLSKRTGEEIDALLDKVERGDFDIEVDTELSETSPNAIANSAVAKALNNKVEKIVGKGLSTNDYTNEEKERVKYANDTIPRIERKTESNTQSIEDIKKSAVKPDESYPKMSVGFADNLVGRGEATAEEFTYRASAGMVRSITDDTARVKKIKGNSVVWNQHTQFANSMANSHGLKFERNGVTLRVSGTVTEAYPYNTASITTPYELVRDGAHKYYISLDAPQGVAYGIAGFSISNTEPFIWSNGAGGTWNGDIAILLSLGDTIDYTFKNPMIVDLTKAFPNDWQNINTVEDFYARIPSSVDIHAYNEGEIINLNTEAIKTVGFNQWDEQWELGTLTDVGAVAHNSAIISRNFNKILPSTAYYCAYLSDVDSIGNILQIGFWDMNMVYIGRFYVTNKVITTPANAAYFKVATNTSANITTYNNDICINLSHTGVENGKYKPYTPFTRELPIIKKYFPNGMRSAGTAFDSIEWDSSKQKWVAVQRVGVLSDWTSAFWGTLTTAGGDVVYYTGTFKSLYSNSGSGVAPNFTCNKYSSVKFNDVYSVSTNKYCSMDSSGALLFRDSTYSTLDDFKASLNDLILYYELAEPIVTEIEEENINFDYYVEDFGTEEALSSVPSAPFRADVVYTFNAVDTIRNNYLEIEEMKKQMAQMQNAISAMQVAQVKEQE